MSKHAADKTITHTIFMVQFTSRSFTHLGETLDTFSGISPGICLPLALNQPYPLITDTIWWVTLSSSPRTPAGGGDLCFHLGALGHLSATKPVPFGLHNLLRTLLLHQPKGLGRCRKILQQHGLPIGFHQRRGKVRQVVWPFHHVGEPISGQGLHCGGSS